MAFGDYVTSQPELTYTAYAPEPSFGLSRKYLYFKSKTEPAISLKSKNIGRQ